MNYLDLSALKTLGTPAYFGLGFIQLKINDRQRLHFWTPEWPTIPGADNEVHDHRYTLTSTVLKGQIRNQLFAPAPSVHPSHEMVEVSCAPQASEDPRVIDRVALVFLAAFVSNPSDTYTLSPDAFHLGGPPSPLWNGIRRLKTTRASFAPSTAPLFVRFPFVTVKRNAGQKLRKSFRGKHVLFWNGRSKKPVQFGFGSGAFVILVPSTTSKGTPYVQQDLHSEDPPR